MKKFVTLAFVLVLLPTAVVVVFVRPVVAQVTIGTIYIKSDGSVEGTDKIQRDGNIYTFTDNIVNQSIIVERDNIVVDGAGYILQGTEAFDSVGIDLTGRKNIIIKNMKIRAFRFGIHLNESSANNIYENNITNNKYGVLFEDSSNNSISGNNVENWPFNIFFFYSSNNTISGNTITKGGSGGIDICESSNNTMNENNITNNGESICFWNSSSNKFYHNNFIGNTQQVLVVEFGDIPMSASTNFWDDGVSEGNYWSDYEEKYPNATELDGSGIWDTPYVINENNQDNYPLISPWSKIPEEENPFWMQLWFWTIVVVLIVALAGAVYLLKKEKPPTPTAPTPPTEGTL